MVTNLNKTIDENIVDFGDDDKNKISSNNISLLHIKNNINNTEKKNFKQERKNRQIQQNFSSFSTSVQKNEVLLKDKSEEITVNNQEKNLILIDIKEKMENKMKNNKIILIKKEKTEDNNNNNSGNNIINLNNNNSNEKNKKILNIPKDSENNNNDNNNNLGNINNNENNNKNKEKDNEKHLEKISQNINIKN